MSDRELLIRLTQIVHALAQAQAARAGYGGDSKPSPYIALYKELEGYLRARDAATLSEEAAQQLSRPIVIDDIS